MKGIPFAIFLGLITIGLPILYISVSHPRYKKSIVDYDLVDIESKYRQEKVQNLKNKIAEIVGENGKVLVSLDRLLNPLPMEENNRILDEVASELPKDLLDSLKDSIEELRMKWEPDSKKVQIGKEYYKNYCMTCHGMYGDSLPVTPEGLKADLGYPMYARDFTGKYHREGKVVFKYASSFLGEMAPDEELKRIIREGLPGTPMPGYPYFTDAELDYIIEYIKSLNPRWKFYKAEVRNYPQPPQDLYSEERIQRGREAFQSVCIACHRNPEAGEEPLEQPLAWYEFSEDGAILKDGENPKFQAVKARYFGKEPLRRPNPSEIFVVIQEGIAGSTMTPWKHLGDEKIWDIVSYIIYLQQKGGVDGNASR
ncbi:MAG: cytochrome c [Candidatus Calescibacterium sp.]|nr:cytochrome c [Candidatus Calescibacterium sp.]MCX7733839.1 cytochrome c [bacterium]MDW8086620.1 cytochrome c [Candidatus Calescibacterium sp.]